MKRLRHVVLIGSVEFSRSVAPLFRPRAQYRITNAPSVTIELLLSKRADIVVMNLDELRYEAIAGIDALIRIEPKPLIIGVSSNVVSQLVASAAEAVLHPSELRNQLPLLVAPGLEKSRIKGANVPGSLEVPLGVAQESVKPGSHIAYLWETEAQFQKITEFWTIEPKCNRFLFGPEDANDKLLQSAKAAGSDPKELSGTGTLHILVRETINKTLPQEIRDGIRASAANKRGPTLVRAIGLVAGNITSVRNNVNVFETQLNNLLRTLPAVMLCPYQISRFSAPLFMKRTLETHPLVIFNNKLYPNPFFTV